MVVRVPNQFLNEIMKEVMKTFEQYSGARWVRVGGELEFLTRNDQHRILV